MKVEIQCCLQIGYDQPRIPWGLRAAEGVRATRAGLHQGLLAAQGTMPGQPPHPRCQSSGLLCSLHATSLLRRGQKRNEARC